MKRFRKKNSRLLPLLLSLVLVVGLVQISAVTASAAYNFSYAYDCQRSPAFPKAGQSFTASSITDPVMIGSSAAAGAAGNWVLTSKGYYTSGMSAAIGASSYFTSVITNVAASYGVQSTQVEVYELTKNGVHVAYGAIYARSSEITTFLGDNWNANGCTYLLSNSSLSGSKTVTIEQDLATSAPQHIHSWQITGDNTDTLTAACVGQGTCSAGGSVSVSIAASSVTLPSSPFNASVRNAQQFEAVTGLKVHPLDTLQRPGYKYKAVGASSFTDPDMNSPKPGTYQAILYVEDANGMQHSAFVQYQAIDPVQTAATGDNRPIEIMIMGLLMCSAMAAAAFVLDSRRRAGR